MKTESRIKQLVALAKEVSDDLKAAKDAADPSEALMAVDPLMKELMNVPGLGISLIDSILTIGNMDKVLNILGEEDPQKRMIAMMEVLRDLMRDEVSPEEKQLFDEKDDLHFLDEKS